MKYLGDPAIDSVSGISGVIEAISIWQNGCIHVGIQQAGKDTTDKPHEILWINAPDVKDQDIKIDSPDLLGKEITDTITGFTGICVCVTCWRCSDSRVQIQSKNLHEGIPVKPYQSDLCNAIRTDNVPIIKPKKKGGPPLRGDEPRWIR